MEIAITLGNKPLIDRRIEPDTYITMSELGTLELKANHLGLYLKTCICEDYSSVSVIVIDKAIDGIDLSSFINGICEENNSIRTLLAKNVVFELSKYEIEIPFSKIYGYLNISKKTIKTK